jgi:hypothetical protein
MCTQKYSVCIYVYVYVCVCVCNGISFQRVVFLGHSSHLVQELLISTL